MSKLKSNLNRILSLLLTVSMVMSYLVVPAVAEGETYTVHDDGWGLNDANHTGFMDDDLGYFKRLSVEDAEGNAHVGYCLDPFTEFNPLRAEGYVQTEIDAEKRARIINVLNLSYPALSGDAITRMMGYTWYDDAYYRYYDATQGAIWNIMTDGAWNFPDSFQIAETLEYYEFLLDNMDNSYAIGDLHVELDTSAATVHQSPRYSGDKRYGYFYMIATGYDSENPLHKAIGYDYTNYGETPAYYSTTWLNSDGGARTRAFMDLYHGWSIDYSSTTGSSYYGGDAVFNIDLEFELDEIREVDELYALTNSEFENQDVCFATYVGASDGITSGNLRLTEDAPVYAYVDGDKSLTFNISYGVYGMTEERGIPAQDKANLTDYVPELPYVALFAYDREEGYKFVEKKRPESTSYYQNDYTLEFDTSLTNDNEYMLVIMNPLTADSDDTWYTIPSSTVCDYSAGYCLVSDLDDTEGTTSSGLPLKSPTDASTVTLFSSLNEAVSDEASNGSCYYGVKFSPRDDVESDAIVFNGRINADLTGQYTWSSFGTYSSTIYQAKLEIIDEWSGTPQETVYYVLYEKVGEEFYPVAVTAPGRVSYSGVEGLQQHNSSSFIYDWGLTKGRQYLLMQYVLQGESTKDESSIAIPNSELTNKYLANGNENYSYVGSRGLLDETLSFNQKYTTEVSLSYQQYSYSQPVTYDFSEVWVSIGDGETIDKLSSTELAYSSDGNSGDFKGILFTAPSTYTGTSVTATFFSENSGEERENAQINVLSLSKYDDAPMYNAVIDLQKYSDESGTYETVETIDMSETDTGYSTTVEVSETGLYRFSVTGAPDNSSSKLGNPSYFQVTGTFKPQDVVVYSYPSTLVRVYKTDSKFTEYLEGAKFGYHPLHEGYPGWKPSVATPTEYTNDQGYVEFYMDFYGLGNGCTIALGELEAPEGYIAFTGAAYLRAPNTTDALLEYWIPNSKVFVPSGFLEIQSLDDSDNTLGPITVNVYAITEDGDKLLTSPTTDDNGYLKLDIPVGEYKVVEVVKPAGSWYANTTEYTRTVTADETAERVDIPHVRDDRPTYGVTYVYDVAEGTEQSIPADGLYTAYPLPTSDAIYHAGDEVNPLGDEEHGIVELHSISSTYYDEGNEGTWTLIAHPSASQTVDNESVEFVLYWSFTVAEKGPITYRFVSGTEDRELDTGVLAYLPEGHSGVIDVTVTPSSVEKTKVYVASPSPYGMWTFEGWDKASAVVTSEGVEFVGTWTFNEYEGFPVTLRFVSSDETRELPQSIVDMTPTNTNTYKPDSRVYCEYKPNYKGEYPFPQSMADGNGTWLFDGWDATSKRMVEGGIEFVGTWTYTEDELSSVVYRFVNGTPEREFYDRIYWALPSDDFLYREGTTIINKDLHWWDDETDPSYFVESKDLEKGFGLWSFKGWDATSKSATIPTTEFVGTWEFTKYDEGKLTVQSLDDEGNPLGPIEIKIMYAYDKYSGDGGTVYYYKTIITTVTDENGYYEIDVPKGKWKVVETEGPENWNPNPKEYVVNVKPDETSEVEIPHTKNTAYYEFVSGTNGRELPDTVMSLLPSDSNIYTVDTVVTAKTFTPTSVREGQGTWTFDSWDADSKAMVTGGIKFTGTWTFTEDPKYSVTYEFTNNSERALPNTITSQLPTDELAYYVDTEITAKTVETTTVRDGRGTWTFGNWDAATKDMVAGGIKFTGAWTYTEDPKYGVTYVFTNGSAGRTLPEGVTNQLPTDSDTYYEGTTINAEAIANSSVPDTVAEGNGMWSFGGWDAESKTMASPGVTFTGEWTFTLNPTYGVTYSYVAHADAGVALPENLANAAPSTTAMYEAGETVLVGGNAAKGIVDIPTASSTFTDPVNDGVWTFSSWSNTEETMTSSGVHFIGTWTFTKNTYPVSYAFVSGTEGKTLPANVTSLLPSDSTKYAAGVDVDVKTLDSTSVREDHGTWTFTEWDAEKKTMTSAGIKFTGTWTFTEDPKYPVTYVFESATEGKALPVIVTNYLPTDSATYYVGTEITAGAVAQTTIREEYGTWTFNEWDTDKQDMVAGGITFTGTWTFTEDPKYRVAYEFSSATEGKTLPANVIALLPSDDTVYYVDTEVSTKPVAQTTVREDHGTWTFNGWDAEKKDMIAPGIKFTGTWTFVEDAKYSVTYEFTNGSPEREFPSGITSQLPTDTSTYYSSSTIYAESVETTSIPDGNGYWTFRGWDSEYKQIITSNVTFTGEWVYTLNPQYGVTYRYEAKDTELSLPETLIPPSTTDLYYEGETVLVSTPSNIPVIGATRYDGDNDGTWTFFGWNAESASMTDEGVTFIGYWTFTPTPYYNVTYSFVSADDSLTLPAEVEAFLPVDNDSYLDETNITAKPAKGTTYETNDYKWTFEGWDATEKQIDGADIHFTGVWSRAVKHPVSYQFINGTPSRALPTAVANLLPTTTTKYVVGTEVTATTFTPVSMRDGNGTWVFGNWDAAKKNMVAGGVTFTGTWTYTEDPKYGVSYEFVSGTVGKELPSNVTELLPSDDNTYFSGTDITAETPESISVSEANGVWNFTGWDSSSKTTSEAGVRFVGTWTYTEDPKFGVVYEFVSATDGKTLPADVMSQLPSDSATYFEGAEVTADSVNTTTIRAEHGTWTFIGWDFLVKNMTTSGVKFTGTWVYAEDAKYGVEYEFTSATEGKSLPAAVIELLPNDSKTYFVDDEITAKNVSPTTIREEHGTWTFNNWDSAVKDIVADGIKFTGTWTYTEDLKYGVTYEFVSGTEGKTLPTDVTNLLPNDSNTYFVGTEITAKTVTTTSIREEHGTWTFTGWDSATKTTTTAGIKFTGTWTYAEDSKYGVAYEFVSGTEGKALPTAVIELLPSDSNTYFAGAGIAAEVIVSTTVREEHGTWNFFGWDSTTKVMTVDGIKFTGTWVFTEDTKYGVTYEFASSTAGKSLPTAVTDLLPSDSSSYFVGTDVSAIEVSTTTVRDGNGSWTFNNWDANEKAMTVDGIKFTGTWTYTEDSKYGVSYEFQSSTEGKSLPAAVIELLPSDSNTYFAGTPIDAKDITTTTVRDGNGTWTFNNWDSATKSMVAGGVKFTGTWTFTLNPTYGVTYSYAAHSEAEVALPESLANAAPSTTATYEAGESVLVGGDSVKGYVSIPTTSSTFTDAVNNGVWTFDSWSSTEEIMTSSGVHFVGTWTFEKNAPSYTVKYEFVSGTTGKVLPQTVIDLTPTDAKTYAEGDEVDAVAPEATRVNVSGGYWTFTGYDRDKLTASAEDTMTFIGTWKYTSTPTGGGSYDTFTTLTVVKTWDDKDSVDRPTSVTVQLTRNGEPYGKEITLNDENGWEHTFKALNDKYEWSVVELNVPEGYEATTTVQGTTVTITNKLKEVEPPAPTPSTPPTDNESPKTDIPSNITIGQDETPKGFPVFDDGILIGYIPEVYDDYDDILDNLVPKDNVNLTPETPTVEVPRTGIEHTPWLALLMLCIVIAMGALVTATSTKHKRKTK